MTPLEQEVREILKSYHCWHTPIDCEGCDMVSVCDKETVEATTKICSLMKFSEQRCVDCGYDLKKGRPLNYVQLEMKLKQSEQEKERLKKALEKIATCEFSNSPELPSDVHDIAQKALEG